MSKGCAVGRAPVAVVKESEPLTVEHAAAIEIASPMTWDLFNRLLIRGSSQIASKLKTTGAPCYARGSRGADDEIRTRDPHLGKVMLYQLSYVRVSGKR